MGKDSRKRTFYLMLIPILVLFFLFNTLPLLRGLLLQLHQLPRLRRL